MIRSGTCAFEVDRDDLRRHRVVEGAIPVAGGGQALLTLDHFALTANNITYGAFGDALGYWRFFPSEGPWGRIPVWGFAVVESSNVPALPVGERLFGYFPMSSHLLVQPERVQPGSFVDGTAHRAGLPPVYNQYVRVAADRGYDPDREHAQSILRPLFMTSFLIDDWLADNDLFGASHVVIASASSKTALGLASLLSEHRRAKVIGLTSASNREMVTTVGYYDRALSYDDVASLPTAVPTVYVDMAGDAGVTASVHRHLRDDLTHSCLVGATHWEDLGANPALPGPRPTVFFAPDRIVQRRKDWGPGGLDERFGAAWLRFLASVDGWLKIEARHGARAVTETYLAVLEGRVAPDQSYVLSV